MKPVLDFLKKLKNNNNRDWFEANKHHYQEAKVFFEKEVETLINSIRKFDKEIAPDLTGKDCTFRIYKDVRFSTDKTPYKTNFGASINPGGKKSGLPGYYLHVEPGNCFFAGGVYMPMPQVLQAIRQEIDYHGKELTGIIQKKDFIKAYGGIENIDMLKKVPKDFDKEHPFAELLKHKHYIASCEMSEKELCDKHAITLLSTHAKTLYPFMQFLRRAVS
jgi:uncharacterized protein (TIGR02453 family)